MCTTNGQSKTDTRSRGGFRFIDGVFHLLFATVVLAQVTSLGKTFGKKMVGLLRGIGVPDNEIRRLQLLAIREKEENPKRRRKTQT